MGNRRMLSKKIVSSARFIKMPTDTQNLYFHLVIAGDDDGIVEAYTVMRLIGSHEDSLKLLVAKEFVRVLNEDLVSHIIDWNEHNTIRADRKIDSVYKDLLLEIVPNAKLIEPKQRSDRPTSDGTSQGQPSDGLSEVKISKDKLIEATEVADYLLAKIKSYNHTFSKSNSTWIADIDRAIRLDNRSKKDLIDLIDFIYTVETFWIPNIMSGKKLREKYDAIYMKMNIMKPKKLQHEKVGSNGFISNGIY